MTFFPNPPLPSNAKRKSETVQARLERKHIFKPLEWQEGAWKCKDLILLLEGSAGSGKSKLAAEKIHALAEKYPGAMILMLRKTRESAINSIVLLLKNSVIPEVSKVKYRPSAHRFEYPNGSIIAWGGMKDEQQRESIRSIGQDGALDFVWMEEAHLFTEGDFEEMIARMRGKASLWVQIILTTNPHHPKHWIHTRLMKGGEATVFSSKTSENAANNPPGYEDNVLGRLTGHRRKRLKEGLWEQPEGLVYNNFSYEKNVIDPFTIPKEWLKFRSVDFGYNDPFVCQWWTQRPTDGALFMYREIYHTQTLVEDMAPIILKLSANEEIEYTVADHDAEGRATLERHGVETIKAYKSIQEGVQAVQARLYYDEQIATRVFFFRDSLVQEDQSLIAEKRPLCTVDEIYSYRWRPNRENKNRYEEPVDLDNHGMDAWRYAEMSLLEESNELDVGDAPRELNTWRG